MKAISLPRAILCAALLAILVGCGGETLQSLWLDREITIDGDPSEWRGALRWMEKSELDVGLLNDEDHLYVCVIVGRESDRRQIMARGMTLWFDPSGGDGTWAGVAVLPGESSDVTLRLHHPLDDVNASFGEWLTLSDYGIGELDFALADFNTLNPIALDVGVSGGLGTEDFTIDVVTSQFLASGPGGHYGPFAFAGDQLLDLHEVDLTPGFLRVRLEHTGTATDLGMSIYPPEVGAMSRVDNIPDGAAFLGLPGEDEWLVIEITNPGRYCIAVYRTRVPGAAKAAAESVEYGIEFLAVTSTPEIAARVTSLEDVYPNPFNPRTTIAFSLRESGAVNLGIYDLRGRLVRNLVNEVRSAGQHRVSWDGIDGNGRTVASGVYIAQFAADGVRERKKLTLVK